MKDYSVLGIICKVMAALLLALFLIELVPLGSFAAILVALLWPALLWSLGELLDRQKVQERKLDRILELLGDTQEPEDGPTELEAMEARLEQALEEDAQDEPEE